MKRNKFRRVSNLLTVICTIIILCCLIYLGKYAYYKYTLQQGVKDMQTLQKEMQEQLTKIDDKEIEDTENLEDSVAPEDKLTNDVRGKKEILPEYQKLKKDYPDMYGHIKIEGLQKNGEDFDYLVMFTPNDINFYEDKNWKGETVTVGTSIWIDGRTKEDTENILIYGHNFKNQSMFGVLKNFKDKSFYEKHKYISFDTLYEKDVYEIICVSESKVYYDEKAPTDEYLFYEHIELDTKKEFDEYIKNAKKNAFYDTKTSAEYGDKLITLCTCDYTSKDGRLIIVAKKI